MKQEVTIDLTNSDDEANNKSGSPILTVAETVAEKNCGMHVPPILFKLID